MVRFFAQHIFPLLMFALLFILMMHKVGSLAAAVRRYFQYRQVKSYPV